MEAPYWPFLVSKVSGDILTNCLVSALLFRRFTLLSHDFEYLKLTILTQAMRASVCHSGSLWDSLRIVRLSGHCGTLCAEKTGPRHAALGDGLSDQPATGKLADPNRHV